MGDWGGTGSIAMKGVVAVGVETFPAHARPAAVEWAAAAPATPAGQSERGHQGQRQEETEEEEEEEEEQGVAATCRGACVRVAVGMHVDARVRTAVSCSRACACARARHVRQSRLGSTHAPSMGALPWAASCHTWADAANDMTPGAGQSQDADPGQAGSWTQAHQTSGPTAVAVVVVVVVAVAATVNEMMVGGHGVAVVQRQHDGRGVAAPAPAPGL